MGSEILRPETLDEAPTSMPEVEFALVLSRMIESVQNDPEHLRATIYELARQKLKEQSMSESPADRRQVSRALETAIQGVETFVKKNDLGALPRPNPGGQPRMLAAPPRAVPVDSPFVEAESSRWAVKRKVFRFSTPWRFATVLGITLAIVLAVTQRAWIRDHASRAGDLLSLTSPKPVQVAAPPAKPATKALPIPETSPTTPTSFGIYAVSGDKLYELELLPGRAPDIRVAVSAAIQTPSRAVLPDGHLKFIVYRRDSATNAVDRPEVRIVAKIERETGFSPAGKAVVTKIEDTWVIRNISIPFRTAPKPDNPDMYEVRSEDPGGALTPGRYALVLKGQAYDFSVAGPISDPRHCLERLAATNGQFYSACQKP
jgi:hypothetical protein